jgi:hypothetical protein
MKIINKKLNMVCMQQQLLILPLQVLFLTFFNMNISLAQDLNPDDPAYSQKSTEFQPRTIFGGTVTNRGYGGVILKFSGIDGKFAFMTGGRGAVTINNRYTIGGGGCGLANSIDLPGSDGNPGRQFKMGYGGPELGYILFKSGKVNIGCSVLIAAGAAFCQNDPESEGEKLFDDDFKIFPVLEPALYGELSLNRSMRLHAGFSYRYVNNAYPGYMTDEGIRGFSCYIGLMFGKEE